jgi:hypothetical protein
MLIAVEQSISLKRLDLDKRSSLYFRIISDEETKFYTVDASSWDASTPGSDRRDRVTTFNETLDSSIRPFVVTAFARTGIF